MKKPSALASCRPALGCKPRRAGFTLMEMLVVIAVIAILIALLLPTISKARSQARTAVCASQLKQIYEGLQSAEFTARSLGNDNFAVIAPGWRSICQPYVRNSRIFICPEDTRMGGDDGTGSSGTSAGSGSLTGSSPGTALPGTPGSAGYMAPLSTLYIFCPQNDTVKECVPGPWVEMANVTSNSYDLHYEDGVDHNYTDVEIHFQDNGNNTVTITLLPNGNPGWKLDNLIDGSTGAIIWHQMYTDPNSQVGVTYTLQGTLIDPTTGTIDTGTNGTQGAITATSGGNWNTPGFGAESSYGMNGTSITLNAIMGKSDKIFGLDYVNSLVLIDDEWGVSPWKALNNIGVAFARHNSRCNVLWGDGSVRASEQDPYQQAINPQGGTPDPDGVNQAYSNAQIYWFASGQFGGY